MQLAHIDFDRLSVSALNMRHGRKPPEIGDILPSIRKRGVLIPLVVRPNGEPESFEILAGRRRYYAMKAIVEEQGAALPLPCAVIEAGDDAAAVEASLLENIARLEPDEMTQYEAFVRLTKEGRSVAEIADTFGITERLVEQRLALGNLLPKIKDAYREELIDSESIRHLTMASKPQQKEWLALFIDPEKHAPRGWQLKQWLFGGQSISTKVALFPLDKYAGPIVSDLFDEVAYFGDSGLFWQKQNEAIAKKRDEYLAARWTDVVILEPGQRFHEWEHEKTPKRKGGKVFIAVSPSGEAEIFEGYLSRKEARQRQKAAEREQGGGAGEAVASTRPLMTKSAENYLELHRHAVVRKVLLGDPGLALRLMVAHAMASSGHWRVAPERQQARNEAIGKSIAASPAQQAFSAEREAILASFERPDYQHSVVSTAGDDYRTVSVLARLLAMSDEEVLRVATFVMAETLAAGSVMVEALGCYLKIDAREHWRPDDAFFDLVRERATVNGMLAEVAGKAVADANVTEKGRAQKQIIRDSLAGANGRAKTEGWLPGFMEFPFRAYGQGTCAIADSASRITGLLPNS